MTWKLEQQRGIREAQAQFAALQERWPLAFPQKSHEVRPLMTGIAAQLCEALGWSNAYARGVLRVWKRRRSYCSAVLCYNERIDLDGNATGEVVDDGARKLAKAQLERMAATRAARDARLQAKQALNDRSAPSIEAAEQAA